MIAPVHTLARRLFTAPSVVTGFTITSNPRGFTVRFNDRFQDHRYVNSSQP